jgi:hypothetical protein
LTQTAAELVASHRSPRPRPATVDHSPRTYELGVLADLADAGELGRGAAGDCVAAVVATGEFEVLADLVDAGEFGRGPAATAPRQRRRLGEREIVADLVDVGESCATRRRRLQQRAGRRRQSSNSPSERKGGRHNLVETCARIRVETWTPPYPSGTLRSVSRLIAILGRFQRSCHTS